MRCKHYSQWAIACWKCFWLHGQSPQHKWLYPHVELGAYIIILIIGLFPCVFGETVLLWWKTCSRRRKYDQGAGRCSYYLLHLLPAAIISTSVTNAEKKKRLVGVKMPQRGQNSSYYTCACRCMPQPGANNSLHMVVYLGSLCWFINSIPCTWPQMTDWLIVRARGTHTHLSSGAIDLRPASRQQMSCSYSAALASRGRSAG